MKRKTLFWPFATNIELRKTVCKPKYWPWIESKLDQDSLTNTYSLSIRLVYTALLWSSR
ncbi:hypothetical protein BY458DRAFT_520759 [Sporodiniella umbellata]|nr:hypothetical protein BY458DRAFT_520759 [Sporodiniella umbellata]